MYLNFEQMWYKVLVGFTTEGHIHVHVHVSPSREITTLPHTHTSHITLISHTSHITHYTLTHTHTHTHTHIPHHTHLIHLAHITHYTHHTHTLPSVRCLCEIGEWSEPCCHGNFFWKTWAPFPPWHPPMRGGGREGGEKTRRLL